MNSRHVQIAFVGAAILIAGAAGYYAFKDRPTGTGISHDALPGHGIPIAEIDLPATLVRQTQENPTPAPQPRDQRGMRSEYQACLGIASEDGRLKRFLELIDGLQPGDVSVVRDLLIEGVGRGSRYSPEWGAFWRKWGEIDAEGASSWLVENGKNRWAGNALNQVLRSWGQANPDKAVAWLSQNEGGPNFESAMLGFVSGRAALDPIDATRRIMSIIDPKDPLANPAMERISEAVLRAGAGEGLRSWFDGLPSDAAGIDFRKAAMDHVHFRLMQQDITAAANWSSSQASKPWRSDRIIGEIAGNWAAQDPAAAMEWVVRQPTSPGNGVIIGVGEVVETWSRSDPGQLHAWLEGARGTQAFEQGARDYAMLLAKTDPVQSLYWAKQVTNAHLRGEAMAAAQGSERK